MLSRFTQVFLSKLADRGGLQWLCEEIAGGRLQKDIAVELGVSPGWLYFFHANVANDPERFPGLMDGESWRDSVRRARQTAALALAEQSIEVLDRANDKDSAAAARAQSAGRQWLAERYDPDTFGNKKQVNVAISLPAMHLAALKGTATPQVTAPERSDTVTIEAADVVHDYLPAVPADQAVTPAVSAS